MYLSNLFSQLLKPEVYCLNCIKKGHKLYQDFLEISDQVLSLYQVSSLNC